MSNENKMQSFNEGRQFVGNRMHAQDGIQHVKGGRQNNICQPVKQTHRPPAPPSMKKK